MEHDNTVKQAGGFIVQLMPFAEEKTIARLEQNLKGVSSVTALLDQGYTPEKLLEKLLGNLGLEINDTVPAEFYCNCSKQRVAKALMSVGKKDLQEMIDEGKEVELNCHFCGTDYRFSVDELKELRNLIR